MNTPDERSAAELFTIVSAVNNRHVLELNLLASPDIRRQGIPVIQREGCASAAEAYNGALDQIRTDYIVFVHQDVYLPAGWFDHMAATIRGIDEQGVRWKLLGVYGIPVTGRILGHIYTSGMQMVLGAPFDRAVEAQSLDECLLVMRRTDGLRLDDRMPGFHLYATDLCQTVRKEGRQALIVSAFCIHNSNGVRYLPYSYFQAYLYLRRKWRDHLDIATCCTRITRSGYQGVKDMVLGRVRYWLGLHRAGRRIEDPRAVERRLGMPWRADGSPAIQGVGELGPPAGGGSA